VGIQLVNPPPSGGTEGSSLDSSPAAAAAGIAEAAGKSNGTDRKSSGTGSKLDTAAGDAAVVSLRQAIAAGSLLLVSAQVRQLVEAFAVRRIL
jgi:hypothetical protein